MSPARWKRLRAPLVVVTTAATLGCGSGTPSPTPSSIAKVSSAPSVAAPLDVDADHDGIEDRDDRCPVDPEDEDGFEDADGCPDPDDDKDSIPDTADKCPREPEVYNGFEDEDGCPDKSGVVIITSNPPPPVLVRFEPGTAVLMPESTAVIESAAAVLKGHPEVLLVEVDGHTDENGDADANVKLSSSRARAVVAALVAQGVEPQRLEAMGFGPYCPLDPRHEAAAWEKNRRVEFRVRKTDQGPTSVLTGCPEATAHGLVSKPVP